MKERPILFSGEMVESILADRKTQTRRVMKPQPILFEDREWRWAGAGWSKEMDVALVLPGHSVANRCPYGQIGDRLWVRETFGIYERIICTPDDLPNFKDKDGIFHPVVHFAGKENYAWGMYGPPRKRSARFMPKSASRIILEIVDVLVERLWRISFQDVRAEGIFVEHGSYSTYIDKFMLLWEKINAERGYPWSENWWVWVIEFKVVKL